MSEFRAAIAAALAVIFMFSALNYVGSLSLPLEIKFLSLLVFPCLAFLIFIALLPCVGGSN